MITPQGFIDVNLTLAGLQARVDAVSQYGWLFDWGMFILLLLAAGAAAWIFIDSTQSRTADKALMPRILSLVGIFFVLPAFIFRYTNNADVVHFGLRLMGETPPVFYQNPIPWNVNWLVADYGPKIAMLTLLGAAVSILAGIIYGSTVRKPRTSDTIIRRIDELSRQNRTAMPAGPTMTPGGMASTVSPSAPAPQRSAATVIERPGAAATIIDRPGAQALAELRVVSGLSAGKIFKLPTSEAKIGRDAANIVAIDDPKASREHAKIRFADGVHSLVDLGSSNGTFLNDRPVAGQTPLADGDLIRIGDTVMSFKPAGA